MAFADSQSDWSEGGEDINWKHSWWGRGGGGPLLLIIPEMCLTTEENHRNTNSLYFTDTSDAHYPCKEVKVTGYLPCRRNKYIRVTLTKYFGGILPWSVVFSSIIKLTNTTHFTNYSKFLRQYLASHIIEGNNWSCQPQYPRSLRRGSAADRLLGLRVRIPSEAWVSVSCQCCVSSGPCDELITR